MASLVVDWLKRTTLPAYLNLLALSLVAVLVIRVLDPNDEPGPEEAPEAEVEDGGALRTVLPYPRTPAVTAPADTGVVARAWAAEPTVGRVSGAGIVDELVGPRSFWLKRDTMRILVTQVVNPPNVPVKVVEVGQTVRLDSAKVKRDGDMSNFPQEAGSRARGLAAEQSRYLLIRTGYLQVRP